ncbi:MAG: flippase [archaeon]
MVNYAKLAVRGAGFLFMSSVVSAGFAYLARIFLARSLSVEEFGLFFAVFSLFSFLELFKDLGLTSALIKYISEFRAKKQFNNIKTVSYMSGVIQLSFAFIISVIVVLMSRYLSTNYFKNEGAMPLIIILSIWFFVSTIQGWIFSIFYGFKRFFLFSFKDISRDVFYFISLVILLKLGYGVLSPAYAWLIATIVSVVIFFPILFKVFNFFKYKFQNHKPLSKKLVLFGLPVTLTSIGGKIIGRIDILMLTYFRSLSEVGVYSIILPTSLLVLLVGKALSMVMFPIGSELWAKKEVKRLTAGLKLMLKYGFLAAVPIGLAFISFGRLFLNLFFGKEYVVGVLAFQILIIGTLFVIIGQINNAVISSIGQPVRVTKVILVSAGVNLVLNLILIPLFGIEGAAISTTISYILICFLSIKELTKIMKFKAPWVDWAKTIVSGVIFVLLIILLRKILVMNPWIELFLILFIAGIIYLISIFFFKIITFSEFKNIKNTFFNIK